MKKSVKIREIIFEIIYEIYLKNTNFEESYLNFTKNTKLNDQERSMVYNIVLNSIRSNFFIQSILKNYLRKRTSVKIKILLITAITQILYLDFKVYAVTNDTVEVAKLKNLNPSLVNSLLKNIISDSEIINKNKIDEKSIPIWFKKTLKKNKIEINKIIKSVSNEPSLHIVFKNKIFLKNFNEEHIKTSETSAFIREKKKITEIQNYESGEWWVQDFSSMLPIHLSPEIKNKKILDICSAPGGKAFQVLSKGNEVKLNDINVKRTQILIANLKRLNFNVDVSNFDGLEISENKKFNVVIIDAPCTGIGTIRRNPEILFKKKPPNCDHLIKKQKDLINKAAKLLKNEGILIYMVCSFLYEETKEIKRYFLDTNKNFSQLKFQSCKQTELESFIDKDDDIYCLPKKFKDFMIDGFYGVKFIKND